jgi:predicted nucleotidyltransferase
MRRDEALRVLSSIKLDLQKRYPVSRIALFGSTARDEATEESDVDVLVEVDSSVGLNFVSLAGEIEKALGHPSDVVSRRAIDPKRWRFIEPDLTDA